MISTTPGSDMWLRRWSVAAFSQSGAALELLGWLGPAGGNLGRGVWADDGTAGATP